MQCHTAALPDRVKRYRSRRAAPRLVPATGGQATFVRTLIHKRFTETRRSAFGTFGNATFARVA